MEDRRRRKMHPRKRNDRAIEYECTRRENKGEHYVKKDKYFYKILYLIFDYPHKHYTFKYFKV